MATKTNTEAKVIDDMSKARPTKIITAKLRDAMIIHIRDQINANLEAIEKSLKIPGHEKLCAAIFSYVVEEFGKIIFLQRSAKLPNDDYEIVYGRGVGFRNHNEKFELADQLLPEDYVEVSDGDFSRKSYSTRVS